MCSGAYRGIRILFFGGICVEGMKGGGGKDGEGRGGEGRGGEGREGEGRGNVERN